MRRATITAWLSGTTASFLGTFTPWWVTALCIALAAACFLVPQRHQLGDVAKGAVLVVMVRLICWACSGQLGPYALAELGVAEATGRAMMTDPSETGRQQIKELSREFTAATRSR